MDNYQSFIIVSGALAKLVIIATLLERGLAFIFEYEWFVRLTMVDIMDPNDNTKKIGEKSRIPGLKGLIALLGSYLCSRCGRSKHLNFKQKQPGETVFRLVNEFLSR